MTQSVDWDLARRTAAKVSGQEPFAGSPHAATLLPDFTEFTTQAETLVAEATGLVSSSGDARARVATRAMWVDANVKSFQRMLRPLLDKMDDKVDSESRMAPLTQKVAGAELGALLGWMSTRVLGQYDMLIAEDENPEDQDIVYYVGPNILTLEKRFAFPPREFRLWLALHEVTHRAQFTGIPWLREHYLGLIERTFDSIDPDPQRFLEALRTFSEKKKAGEDPLADGGVMALVASSEQREVLDEIAGLMSLLEGHGDVTMDRAGADQLPSAERFGKVLRHRRQSSKGFLKLFQRLVGLDAKLQQYAQGEAFIEAVEKKGGPELLNRAWDEPTNLPSIKEIREPQLWLDRIGPLDEVVASS